MTERRSPSMDHDLLIRIDENVKNLRLEFQQLKEVDIKELKDGTKVDIETLKTNKAEKKDMDDLDSRTKILETTITKYVAYATLSMTALQLAFAFLIHKFG